MLDRGAHVHDWSAVAQSVRFRLPIHFVSGNVPIIRMLCDRSAVLKIGNDAFDTTPLILAVAIMVITNEAVSFLFQRGDAKHDHREEAYHYGCFGCSAEYGYHVKLEILCKMIVFRIC